jgi:asparagine synthase (glutamine-hydrolysing)
MTAAIRHRGPDGDGFWSDARAALGHRRLSIIDRAGGAQPLGNEDLSVQVVFNGEIYNHHEIRAQLEARGHRFRTRSDGEVIVHGWEEWGTSCAERLHGMFAFALWDSARGELYAARDRLGKKPLFWAELDGALHFASEIKSLRRSPAWDGEIEPRALEGYLSLGYVPAPWTLYRHVKKLEPAHWMHLAGGRLDLRRYWDIPAFDSDGRPEGEILAELEGAVHDAVAARLESEVPLGAFLSGGIDSGLVVSFMAGAMSERPLTVSVGFDDSAHNELEAAARVAGRFSTRHHPEILTPRLDEMLDTVLRGCDEPFADSSAIPTFYVCAGARRHVTVCLSGDGGDETFGGYDFRYVPHAWEDRARRLLPGRPLRRVVRGLGHAWPRSPRLPRALRLGTLLENVGLDPADAYYSDLCFLKPADARLALGEAPDRDPRRSPVYELVTAPYRRCPSPSVVQRAQYADLMVYLPNDPLVKVDRMSMQHGLEVRCPLLDHRVVELAFRVPTSVKMPGLRAKHLLRRLAERRLPPENLHLPKRGFTAPVARWLAGPDSERFASEVLGPDGALVGLLDLDVLRRWLGEHRSGRADRSYVLWAAWVLDRWARNERSGSAESKAAALARSA